MGKKTSERIALELKDRAAALLAESGPPEGSPAMDEARPDKAAVDDAVSALMNLGYPARSATQAVEKAAARHGGARLDALIKESLRLLS